MAESMPRDMGAWISSVNRALNRLDRRGGNGGPRQVSLPAPPTAGQWDRASIAWNTNPEPGGVVGWVCVATGTPGTWRAFATASL